MSTNANSLADDLRCLARQRRRLAWTDNRPYRTTPDPQHLQVRGEHHDRRWTPGPCLARGWWVAKRDPGRPRPGLAGPRAPARDGRGPDLGSRPPAGSGHRHPTGFGAELVAAVPLAGRPLRPPDRTPALARPLG